jgi:hypothetical protein
VNKKMDDDLEEFGDEEDWGDAEEEDESDF